MEVSVCQLAYFHKDKKNWFPTWYLVERINLTKLSVPCLKVQQAKSESVIVSIDEMINNFLDKVELDNFMGSSETDEHFVDFTCKKNEVCHYIVVR